MEKKTIKVGDETVIIPVPCNYRDCFELARSDYYRYTGKKASSFRLWIASIRNTCFRVNFWLRLSAYEGSFHRICAYMHRRYSLKRGLEIPYQTAIGYGLYIGHGFGIIINPTAVIGNNVNLSQFTTIGSNEGKAALIGNNVYIGPSVCLVEDVIIGSDTCIGAGAVVTKDVPKGMTAVGVPAKVIGVNKHRYYITNRWEYK